MARMFALILFGLFGLTWVMSADASWQSTYLMGQNQGYCATPPRGMPLGDYMANDVRFCPENRKPGRQQQKKPKPALVEKPKTSIVGCSATPIRYRFRNETVRSSLNAKAGERCVLTRKPDPGSTIGALKIITPPRNGSIQSLEGYSVAYTPRSGFKGSDYFVQRVCGDDHLDGTNCTNIEYAVTVY